mmetsp:Transcript_22560/g.48845  ORF Transcript_22560/g.48845 Transcript_22560/m.48845 type:complete len:678 (-) Transcript_22560:147-2180(-)
MKKEKRQQRRTRWSKKTAEQHLLDDDEFHHGHAAAPIPVLEFKTPKHDNGTGSRKLFTPPFVGNRDDDRVREHGAVSSIGTNSPPRATKKGLKSPSVRFRDRSASPPPRAPPPPPMMRAKTIKARGGGPGAQDHGAHESYCHSSVEESRSHGSHSGNSVVFMSAEDVPFFDAEEGYMQGYGATIDQNITSITKTVKARGGGGFLRDDLICDDDDDNDEHGEEQPEESAPRSAKELWMKLRNRIQRGSFMVHSFSSHASGSLHEDDATDDDAASFHGSIFSGGASVTKEETALTRRSGMSAVSTAFADLDLPYEITLSECCGAIILYLLVGVIAYSFVFQRWSIVDSLYFTIVTGTLVGYGDITPTYNASKIFTSIFALTSVAFLGLVIGVLGSRMVEYEVNAVQKANREMMSQVTGFFRFKTKREGPAGLPRSSSADSIASLQSNLSYASLASLESLQADIADGGGLNRRVIDEHVMWYRQMIGLVCRYLPAMIPVLLASLLVAFLEEWDLCNAFYFFVATTATIGYGDIVPQTDAMKIFAVFFIPLAVGAVGHTLGTVANFIIERRREIYQKKVWSQELKVGDLELMDWDGDGIVTKLDYVEFMLLTLKKVDSDLLDELHEQFAQLDTNRSGSLTKHDLQVLAKKRLRQVRHKLKLSSYKYELLHKNRERKKKLEE